MIHFYENTKVYLYAPAGVVTGGSELLHQLVDLINKNGKEAYIVYCGKDNVSIPNDYKNYFIRVANDIEDSKENIVIIYEGMFNKVSEIKESQILLWWLSVDLLYHSSMGFLCLRDIWEFSHSLALKAFVLRLGRLILKNKNEFKNNISFKELKTRNLTNAYQSVYAQNYMYKMGFDQLFSLTDYINVNFLNGGISNTKENIVVYNPKKGFKFTKKIIKANPDLNFVPIQNLDRNGVIELLGKAKVYIDFGFHPGKDRIPREAALLGCIIITDRRGSAFYYEDVSIPNEYKFIDKNKNIKKISAKIRDCLEHYDIDKKNMEHYCNKIKKEKKIFENEVKDMLSF